MGRHEPEMLSELYYGSQHGPSMNEPGRTLLWASLPVRQCAYELVLGFWYRCQALQLTLRGSHHELDARGLFGTHTAFVGVPGPVQESAGAQTPGLWRAGA